MGRRPGNPDTRNTLVVTARRLFAEGGYDKTSIRDIASAAQVDPALVRHYFGNKAGLFRATMGWPFEPAQLGAYITGGGPDEIAARLTLMFLTMWEQPDTRTPLLAILRGATTHEESATLVRQFIAGHLYPQLAEPLAHPDATLRIDLAIAQLLGVALLRYILKIEPIASEPMDGLIERLTPTVSAHLGGPSGVPARLGDAAD
ncbi:TetR/AcrR family transcriptional regulator [Mycobacterium pinniadriaticum]